MGKGGRERQEINQSFSRGHEGSKDRLCCITAQLRTGVAEYTQMEMVDRRVLFDSSNKKSFYNSLQNKILPLPLLAESRV